jgi:hypothetical protein
MIEWALRVIIRNVLHGLGCSSVVEPLSSMMVNSHHHQKNKCTSYVQEDRVRILKQGLIGQVQPGAEFV